MTESSPRFWMFVLDDGETWQTYGTLAEVFLEARDKLILSEVMAILSHGESYVAAAS